MGANWGKVRIGLFTKVLIAALSVGVGFSTMSAFAQEESTEEEIAQQDTAAQDPARDDAARRREAPKLEEITVTAQKRSETAQTVPISISVATAETMEKQNIQTFSDLSLHTPNFFVDDTGTVNRISMRGLGSSGVDDIESSVGTYIDGIYIKNANRLTQSSFFDLARIEVLRGPQGTLYGKNSIAGAINVITAKPTKEFEAYMTGEYGSYGANRLEGAVSGSILENLSGRLALMTAHRGSWMKNDVGRNGGGYDDEGVRASLLWEPTDKLDVLMKYEYFNHEERGDVRQLLGMGPGTIVDTPVWAEQGPFEMKPDRHQSVKYRGEDGFDLGSNPGQTNKSNLGAITLDYNFDSGYTLTSVSGYSYYKADRRLDVDISPVDAIAINTTDEFTSWSEELRIASPLDQPFHFIAGIYVDHDKDEHGRDNNWAIFDPGATGQALEGVNGLLVAPNAIFDPASLGVAAAGAATVTADLPPKWQVNIPTYAGGSGDTRSAYFEGTYDFNPEWSLTGGVRYSHEAKKAYKRWGYTNSDGEPLSPTAFIPGLIGSVATDPAVLAAGAVFPGVPADLFGPGFPAADIPAGYMGYLTWAGTAVGAVSYAVVGPQNFAQGDEPPWKDQRSAARWLPSGKLKYQPNDDMMFYGAVVTGFKNGGFNVGAVSPQALSEFKEETSIAYELGSKLTLFEDMVRFNLALFWTNFDDLQVSTLDPASNTVLITNAAKATTRGVEVEGAWAATDYLTLSANYGYTDATYDKFPNGPCGIYAPPGCVTQDLKNEDVLLAPNNSAGGTIELNFPIGLSDLEIGSLLGVTYRDKSFTSLADDLENDSITLLNARIALRSPEGKWEFSVSGSNLTDSDSIQLVQPVAILSNILDGSIVPPRMFTVGFKKWF